jgi:hypothetical protein
MKKRFVTRRFLYRGETTGGWYIWDKEHNNWAEYIERRIHGSFDKRKDAFEKIEELEAKEIAEKI